MKRFVLLLICLVCFSHPTNAEQMNSLEKSLSAGNADGLVSMSIDENLRFLPDFSAYSELAKIETDEKNSYYCARDGVLYSKDLKTLICYPTQKENEIFVLPGEVENILSGAFSGNDNIKEVQIGEKLKSLGANPFSGCRSLRKIEVSEKNSFFASENGILYNKDKTECIACPAFLKKAELPKTLKTVSYQAFSGCRRMRKITLPEGVEKIESMAFEGCTALYSMTLPKGVKNVNASAFVGCRNLEYINSESDYFKSIDGILYSYDMRDLICCPNGKWGRIVLPDGVVNIANGAFSHCKKITEVRFPESVEYIACAFENCESLENISLPKTQAIIEYGTFYGCKNLEWVYLPGNVVIVQNDAFSGACPVIYCDEDSFASYFAEENNFIYRYKYNIISNGEILCFSNQPYCEDGEIYIPLCETLTQMGGNANIDYSTKAPVGELGEISFVLTDKRVQKTRKKQTEIIDGIDEVSAENEVYINIDDFARIFDMEQNRANYNVEFTKRDVT